MIWRFLVCSQVFDKHNRGYITASDLRAVLQCLGEDLSEEESTYTPVFLFRIVADVHTFPSARFRWSRPCETLAFRS